MNTLQTLTARANNRLELTGMWLFYEDTIIEHIIKILIIDSSITTAHYWLKEIGNHLSLIKKNTIRIKPDQKFYDNIVLTLSQDKQSINNSIKDAVKSYINNKDRNPKGIALVRECHIDDLISTTNFIIKEIIQTVSRNDKAQLYDNQRIESLYTLFWNKNLTYPQRVTKDNFKILKTIIKGLK